VRQQGYFISGKFDQFKRDIPYSSIIQSFQELMRQLLTENAEKIADWKRKLLDAFGSNGLVITEVIPEVELIVGQQPPVPQLGQAESQNRFNRVFKQFIQVFTKKEHPLVLFLDDLQWADSASLKLIQLLMTEPDSQYLLLIGAYRDNEVSATHPLMLALDTIHQTSAKLTTIILRPLDIGNVSQLVADTLKSETSKVQPLAELVFKKTQGNPFFLTQLLKSLYQEKLLSFDFSPLRGSKGGWRWDIKQIQDVDITDNVVELMVNQIQKLATKTQNLLKLAACIGDKFTLDVLAIVNEKSFSETAANLWEALQVGLVLPMNNFYKIPLVFILKK
jgi:predicted ATPase